MKRALIYSLSLALLLSLTACHRAQAEQQDTNQPEPAAVSTPADISTPEPEKPAAPEQLSSKAEQTEPEELSGEALTHYFKLAYDGSKAYVSGLSTEEAIDWEIDVLGIRAQNENQRLPDDYRDQYRAWRPVDEASATAASTTQQVSDTTKNQTQNQNQNQGSTQQQQQQSQTQTQSPQNQGTPQQSKSSSSSDAYDPYDGYGSYNAYIDHICQELPQLSREEIIQRFPDPATGKLGEATIDVWKEGLLGG